MARWTYNFFNSLKYKFGPSSFYLLPTIEFCSENMLDDKYNDEDCSLDIVFEWLWFGFCITKYWGSTYER